MEHNDWLANPAKQAGIWRSVEATLENALREPILGIKNDLTREARNMAAATAAAYERTAVSSRTDKVVARGLDIRHDQRCSTEDRLRYQEHLANMFAEGRLSKETWEARHDAAAEAVTPGELEVLVRDLPSVSSPPAPLPSPVPASKQFGKAEVAAMGVIISGITLENVSIFSQGIGENLANLAMMISALFIIIKGNSSKRNRQGK